jgi:hypothetical protein
MRGQQRQRYWRKYNHTCFKTYELPKIHTTLFNGMNHHKHQRHDLLCIKNTPNTLFIEEIFQMRDLEEILKS